MAVVVVAAAYMVAPHACSGGLTAYVLIGLVALCVLLVLPFATAIGSKAWIRAAWACGFAAFGASAWVAGLLLANVRFICGLGYL